MDIRNPALDLAFSLGNVGGVTIRVSYFFPLLFVILLYRLGVPLGLIVSSILVASVLFHEFAHIWGARGTGGSGDEIFLWPLGGLAMVRPAPGMLARVVTSLMGPFSNLAICLACVPATIKANVLSECLNPLQFPPIDLQANHWGVTVQVIAFSINWMLFLVNLLPILPFDGGQIVLAFLERNRSKLESRLRAIVVSLFGGVIVGFAGAALDSTMLLLLSTFMLLLNLNDFWKTRLSIAVQLDGGSDSGFMGYDFSQGYTSLEREEEEEEDTQVQPTMTAREERRRQREAEERAAAEARLDELLEKVHKQGMESLTEEERRFLQQASSRYRRS